MFGDWVELDWTQEMVEDLQSLLHGNSGGNSGGGEATVIETSDIVSVLSKVNVLFPPILFFRHNYRLKLSTQFYKCSFSYLKIKIFTMIFEPVQLPVASGSVGREFPPIRHLDRQLPVFPGRTPFHPRRCRRRVVGESIGKRQGR